MNNKTNPNLTKRVDFMMMISANNCDPNAGLDGQPRTDEDGYGLITDVCIKRKIRNAMQDAGASLLYQSAGRETDGMHSIEERVKALPEIQGKTLAERLCATYTDVRLFGAVVAYSSGAKKADKKAKAKKAEEDDTLNPDLGAEAQAGASIPVNGAVTIQLARSVDPVELRTLDITKSLNGTQTEKAKSSDTIGSKSMVKFGLYVVKGSINARRAQKNGLTDEDVAALKQAIVKMFINDESASRPAGSMNVEKVYWWEHGSLDGDVPSAALYRTVKAENVCRGIPASMEDYDITYNGDVAAQKGIKTEVYDPMTGWKTV